MKATIVSEPKQFKPFTLNITFETEEEAHLFRLMVALDVTLPQEVVKNFRLLPSQATDLRTILCTIRETWPLK